MCAQVRIGNRDLQLNGNKIDESIPLARLESIIEKLFFRFHIRRVVVEVSQIFFTHARGGIYPLDIRSYAVRDQTYE